MSKKITGFGIALVMLVCTFLAGCWILPNVCEVCESEPCVCVEDNRCTDCEKEPCECAEIELLEYKASAIIKLQEFFDALDEDDYTTDNWAVIQGLVTTGKAAIDTATDKAGVDTALTGDKEAIGEVERVVRKGHFYSLQEAYDNGWITRTHLLDIAYFSNDSVVFDVNSNIIEHTPLPKNPEFLDDKTALRIRQDFFVRTMEANLIENGNYTIDDVNITQYVGIYNGFIAIGIFFENDFEEPTTGNVISIIGDVLFSSNGLFTNGTILWTNKNK